MAKRKLPSLKKRFTQNSEFFEKYNAKMAEYLERCAEPASGESLLPSRINYISHHCTAANTNFKVVFYCSACFNGTSLNDKLLHGPDLTNSVVGDLLRFRQFSVGIVGDIKAMFFFRYWSIRTIEIRYGSCSLKMVT